MKNSPISKDSTRAFRLVMLWSGIIFIAAIIFGLIYRIIYPVELHLDEDQYIKQVFVETETKAFQHPDEQSNLIGTYDAGSILYVMEEAEDYYMVRPFIVSKVDSVWVVKDSTSTYTQESYERWLYEEERRKFDLE